MKYLTVVLIVAIIGLVTATTRGEKMRYDNYHVYLVQPRTEAHLKLLRKFESPDRRYIFLDPVTYVNVKIRVAVAPDRIGTFVQVLEQYSIPYKLIDTNLQATLDNGNYVVADFMNGDSEYTWEKYHTLEHTYNWLHGLEVKYPDIVTPFIAGETYEGRHILGVKISYGPDKKGIFLEGGMHGREWISPATTTYIINQLLTSEDKEVRMVAESFDWYIIPHANPDGYVFTHTTDRMWQKTRTPYGDGCYGADPNRNWGFHWNEIGASDNPCSEFYAGPSAFSEIETKSLSEYIASLKDEILLYVSFHSYSQMVFFPYGHTDELPPNYDDLMRVLDVAIPAAAKLYGTKYTGGNIYNTVYPSAGNSLDWVYGELGIKYSFGYELRPSSEVSGDGFMLSADQIKPTGEETLLSVIAMIEKVKEIDMEKEQN